MMDDLYKFLGSLGWFSGKINFQLNFHREFEGFYGKASEDWESQYTVTCNEIKSNDKVLIPVVNMSSIRFESLDDFCKRVLKAIKNGTN